MKDRLLQMKDRLRFIRLNTGMSQRDFGNSLCLTGSAVNLYENGKRTPPPLVIANICKLYHIREEWLRTGEGAMYQECSQFDYLAESFGRALVEKDPLLLGTLQTIADLPPESRSHVLSFLRSWAKNIQSIEDKNETPEG